MTAVYLHECPHLGWHHMGSLCLGSRGIRMGDTVWGYRGGHRGPLRLKEDGGSGSHESQQSQSPPSCLTPSQGWPGRAPVQNISISLWRKIILRCWRYYLHCIDLCYLRLLLSWLVTININYCRMWDKLCWLKDILPTTFSSPSLPGPTSQLEIVRVLWCRYRTLEMMLTEQQQHQQHQL